MTRSNQLEHVWLNLCYFESTFTSCHFDFDPLDLPDNFDKLFHSLVWSLRLAEYLETLSCLRIHFHQLHCFLFCSLLQMTSNYEIVPSYPLIRKSHSLDHSLLRHLHHIPPGLLDQNLIQLFLKRKMFYCLQIFQRCWLIVNFYLVDFL